jgi:hypothetical protein
MAMMKNVVLAILLFGVVSPAWAQQRPKPEKPAETEEEAVTRRHQTAALQLQRAYGKPIAHVRVGADGKYQTHVSFSKGTIVNPALPLLPELFNVKSIYAPTATMNSENAEALAKLSELEELQVYFTGFGDAGLVHLAGLKKLKAITANHCPITDKGAEAIAKIENLEILDLTGTLVTDAALEHLTKLANLRGLAVAETRVTPAAWEKFKREHPKLEDGAIMEFHKSHIVGGVGGR